MKTKEIQPIESFSKTLALPGSKSISNRVLIMAALARGTSTITNLARCDDTGYLLEVLQLLGIKIKEDSPTVFHITGTGGVFKPYAPPFSIGNAGTCMRFLTSFLTIGKNAYTLDGNERMRERPIQDLVTGLQQLGARIDYLGEQGYPPITIHGAGFPGGEIAVPGNKSSQYITSLLLSAPYGKKDFKLTIKGDIASQPYLDMTIKLMARFGIKIHVSSPEFTIKTPQEYIPNTIQVEGDASSASYFFAAAALTKSRITISNIPSDSVQGDSRFPDILEKMGCVVTRDNAGISVEGTSSLHGISIDLNDMPDTVQTLAVLALFAEGKTSIRNVANLRIKETDRISALVTELRKLGASVEEFDDGISVTPGNTVRSAEIATYDDHRMAMSFTLAGLRVPGIIIQNPAVVTKSFPEFYDYVHALSQ